MKSFANDPSLDRVLLISREEMGGAAGGFDPLHPVYTQTEGADPFTYRNDFCHMRLLADGTMELTEFGRPARFAEEWRQLLSQLAACRTLTDLRIYDYDGDEPPMAAALTTYGRLLLYGNAGEYAPAAGWQGVARVFWDTDGFGALCEDDMFRAVGALSALDGIGEEEAVGSALPGHCSPVAYLLQKNGTVTLFDRKNKSIQRPRERVQKIALVRYNPYGVSTWVALSKITGRFLCSEPRDSISADFFGGDYTDIIAPNRFRQKIADFAAVPRAVSRRPLPERLSAGVRLRLPQRGYPLRGCPGHRAGGGGAHRLSPRRSFLRPRHRSGGAGGGRYPFPGGKHRHTGPAGGSSGHSLPAAAAGGGLAPG